MNSFTLPLMETRGQKFIPNNIFLKKSNIIKNSKTIIFVADALQIKNLNS